MITRISTQLGLSIASHVRKEHLAPVYSYAILVLSGYLFQGMALALIAVQLDCLLETTVVSLSFIILRRFTGGAHFSAMWKCLFSSLVLFSLLGFFAYSLASVEFEAHWIGLFATGSYFISMLLIYRFTPTPTPHRVISPESSAYSQARRKAFVFLSLGVVIGVFCLLVDWAVPSVVVAFWLGTVFQAITVSPFGFQAIKGLDTIKFDSRGGDGL